MGGRHEVGRHEAWFYFPMQKVEIDRIANIHKVSENAAVLRVPLESQSRFLPGHSNRVGSIGCA